MPETPDRPRRRFAVRVTLGGLMLLIVALAVWMGWATNKVRKQSRAVDAIIARGGQVIYAHQRAPMAANPNAINANAKPPGPEWLRKRIGDDYFQSPVHVSIARPAYQPNTARMARKPIPPPKPHDDDIMVAFADLPDLEFVNLDRGPTTDAGLAHLAGLKKLRTLLLGEADDITDVGLAHLAGLTKLDRLVIFNTGKITDAGVAHFSRMKSLTSLWITHENLTDEALKTIGGLPALENLLVHTESEASVDPIGKRAGKGKIGDVGLGYLAGLGHMKSLALPATAAGKTGFEALAKLESLESLRVETGPLSEGMLSPLRSLPKLRSLFIESPAVDDSALECLATFPALSLLEVHSPTLSPANLDCIARADQLTYITLDCPNLTDDQLAHIGTMKRLKTLQLVNVEKITDSGIEVLRGLNALGVLAIMSRGMQGVFAKCQITDRGLSTAAALPKIRMVRIYSPRITKAGLDRVKKECPGVSLDDSRRELRGEPPRTRPRFRTLPERRMLLNVGLVAVARRGHEPGESTGDRAIFETAMIRPDLGAERRPVGTPRSAGGLIRSSGRRKVGGPRRIEESNRCPKMGCGSRCGPGLGTSPPR